MEMSGAGVLWGVGPGSLRARKLGGPPSVDRGGLPRSLGGGKRAGVAGLEGVNGREVVACRRE